MLTKKAKSSLQFSVQEEKKNRETGPTLIAKFVITLPAWRYRACSAQRETMSMIDHYVVYGSQEWRRERERERTSKKPKDGNAPQAQTSQSEKTHTKQKKKNIFWYCCFDLLCVMRRSGSRFGWRYERAEWHRISSTNRRYCHFSRSPIEFEYEMTNKRYEWNDVRDTHVSVDVIPLQSESIFE